MKLFTFIVFVLAFWPILLDCSVSGRTGETLTFPLPLGLSLTPSPTAPLPTFVLPTKTYAVGSALDLGTAVPQVLPTAHMAHQNKGAQSSASTQKRWPDSTVLIWTVYQVDPVRGRLRAGNASLDLVHRYVQAAWSRIRHCWRVGSVWLVDAVVTFIVYLLFSITVGVTLLSKSTVERRVAVARTLRKLTFVSTTTLVEGSSVHHVHGLVTQRPQSITTFTLEGRLVLSSRPTALGGRVEWTVLFHPRQHYRPTGPATESRNLNTHLDVDNKYLLNILLHGVSYHHPWTLHLPGVLVNVPREVIGKLHSPRKPASATTITCVGATAQRTIREPFSQRRLPPRKPTFIPSITRLALPKPAVRQNVLMKRPRGPAPWIEKFTLEGRVLLYAGCTIPGRPVEWRIRFDPRQHFYLTRDGDNSSNRPREFADGRLVGILLYGDMAYPLSVVYVIDLLLDIPRELVKRSSNVTRNLLELTITATTLPPSAFHTPEVTTTIDSGAYPIDTLFGSVQLEAIAEPGALMAFGLCEARNPAERDDEPFPTSTEENARVFGELVDYSDSHTPDSEEAEPVTPIPEPPSSANHTSLDTMSDDLIREQKAAVIHELLLVFLLEGQAGRPHAHEASEDAWMEVAKQGQVEENVQQNTVGEASVEKNVEHEKAEEAPLEDVHEEEVYHRRKRRGGKKNTAWKHKRRQEKEDRERDPEAGPSALR